MRCQEKIKLILTSYMVCVSQGIHKTQLLLLYYYYYYYVGLFYDILKIMDTLILGIFIYLFIIGIQSDHIIDYN